MPSVAGIKATSSPANSILIVVVQLLVYVALDAFRSAEWAFFIGYSQDCYLGCSIARR